MNFLITGRYRTKKNKRIFYFSLSVAMTYTLSLVMVYLFTPHDLTWHLSSSASRTILSPAFLLIFFGILQTYYKYEKKLKKTK